MKKTPGDIIILHKCNKNHDHMLFCSWDMACDKCNCYFSFWVIFCPYTTQKTKILKKMEKNPLEISSFYIYIPKIMIRWCMVPEIWCATDSRTDRWTEKWHIEVGAPPKNPKNQNFEKWKNLLEILSFYSCVPKIIIIWCMVPEIQSETDIIFCHFGSFFALLPSPPPPPPPPNDLKYQNFEKIKNTLRYHFAHV